MKLLKRIGAIVLAAGMTLLLLTGCGSSSSGSKSGTAQLGEPQKGDTIATITVKDFGVIKARLFPEAAPKGVENFVEHAKAHYYDGLKFHRIVEDFMIQGGDPEGTGMGGESIWGKGFGVEYDGSLRHYTGALAYAHSQLPDSNGSQFYIVNNSEAYPTDDETYEQFVSYVKMWSGVDVDYPQDVREAYAEHGGVPYLDGQYTVFGQVYEGLDVLDKIMAVEKVLGSDDALSLPVEDVIIESITISVYGED